MLIAFHSKWATQSSWGWPCCCCSLTSCQAPAAFMGLHKSGPAQSVAQILIILCRAFRKVDRIWWQKLLVPWVWTILLSTVSLYNFTPAPPSPHPSPWNSFTSLGGVLTALWPAYRPSALFLWPPHWCCCPLLQSDLQYFCDMQRTGTQVMTHDWIKFW